MKTMIGENIRRLRNLKDITQAQLADAMNVSPASVSKWERGDSYPDITLLQPLAYYFNVTIDEIMGYDYEKIEQEIDNILKYYYEIYPIDFKQAREIIAKARCDFPNNFRIMDCYMWNLAGDYADNDKTTLLKHKSEFSHICEMILCGCTDNRIRLDAINMQAKLLWAEGKSDEAVILYEENFPNWYQTSGQKVEQLFAKNTDEFMNTVQTNLYELASFAADKLVKTIFYNRDLTVEEKIQKAEMYGDLASEMNERTDDILFIIVAKTIYGRLANDLLKCGYKCNDIDRIKNKYFKALDKIVVSSKTNSKLRNFAGREYGYLI